MEFIVYYYCICALSIFIESLELKIFFFHFSEHIYVTTNF